ncbi:caspase family protein [Sphingomonas sp.]|uniref:caspase family protein n=1 Tax=Sphingomonas sp. TaxID=28214 RepID=UPI003AFF725E
MAVLAVGIAGCGSVETAAPVASAGPADAVSTPVEKQVHVAGDATVAAVGSAPVDVPRSSRPTLPTNYALVVGINAYTAFNRLNYCCDDAVAVAAQLVDHGGYTADHVALRVDVNPRSYADFPTRDNLLTDLARFAALPLAGDTLLFYYSGHGSFVDGKSYLVPVDARSADPGQMVALSDVRDILGRSRAKWKVLVIDACHSGGEKDGRPEPMQPGFARELTDGAAAGEGFLTLASCTRDETSMEDPEHHRGLFTYWMLRGLGGEAAGPDGLVPLMGLFNYLSRAVPADAIRRFHRSQTPTLSGIVSGNLILAAVPPPATPVPSALSVGPVPQLLAGAQSRQATVGTVTGPPRITVDYDLAKRYQLRFIADGDDHAFRVEPRPGRGQFTLDGPLVDGLRRGTAVAIEVHAWLPVSRTFTEEPVVTGHVLGDGTPWPAGQPLRIAQSGVTTLGTEPDGTAITDDGRWTFGPGR